MSSRAKSGLVRKSSSDLGRSSGNTTATTAASAPHRPPAAPAVPRKLPAGKKAPPVPASKAVSKGEPCVAKTQKEELQDWHARRRQKVSQQAQPPDSRPPTKSKKGRRVLGDEVLAARLIETLNILRSRDTSVVVIQQQLEWLQTQLFGASRRARSDMVHHFDTMMVLVETLERHAKTPALVLRLVQIVAELTVSITKNQEVFLRTKGIEALSRQLFHATRAAPVSATDIDLLLGILIILADVAFFNPTELRRFVTSSGLDSILALLRLFDADTSTTTLDRLDVRWAGVLQNLGALVIELAKEDVEMQSALVGAGVVDAMAVLLAKHLHLHPPSSAAATATTPTSTSSTCDGLPPSCEFSLDSFVEPLLTALATTVMCHDSARQALMACIDTSLLLSFCQRAYQDHEVVYFPSLFLCVSLLYGTGKSDFGSGSGSGATAHGGGGGGGSGRDKEGERALILEEALQMYTVLKTSVLEARQHAFEPERCAMAINRMTEQMEHNPEAQYMLLHVSGAISLLICSLNNCDEMIRQAACLSTYYLLLNNPEGQYSFMRQNGLHALSACIDDYLPHIRCVTLEMLSILTSDHEFCREQVRELGILEAIVRLLSDFPQDAEVTTELMYAAVDVVSHVVSHSTNQNYVREVGGLKVLTDIANTYMAGADGGSGSLTPASELDEEDVYTAVHSAPPSSSHSQSASRTEIEALLGCLGNLCFHNVDNQSVLGSLDLLDTVVEYLHTGPPESVAVSALSLLINLVDRNPENQTRLGHSPRIAALLEPLLRRAPRVQSVAVLLLSHFTWNCPLNQGRIVESPTLIPALVKLLRSAIDSCDRASASTSVSPSKSGSPRDHPAVLHLSHSSSMRSVRSLCDVTEDSSSYELLFYGLLALSNTVFGSQPGQDKVAACADGVAVVVAALVVPIVDIMAAAGACLGNLVKNHQRNTEQLVQCGGVPSLVAILSDEEEDPVSTKAFLALCHMGAAAPAELLRLIHDEVSGQHQPPDKYLAVLNGILYMNGCDDDTLRAMDLSPLAALLSLPLSSASATTAHTPLSPAEVSPMTHELVAHCLANATASHSAEARARTHDLLRPACQCIVQATAGTATAEMLLVLLYSFLHNVCLHCGVNLCVLVGFAPSELPPAGAGAGAGARPSVPAAASTGGSKTSAAAPPPAATKTAASGASGRTAAAAAFVSCLVQHSSGTSSGGSGGSGSGGGAASRGDTVQASAPGGEMSAVQTAALNVLMAFFDGHTHHDELARAELLSSPRISAAVSQILARRADSADPSSDIEAAMAAQALRDFFP